MGLGRVYLESQWPIIMGYFGYIMRATLGYSGLLFWATWLSRCRSDRETVATLPDFHPVWVSMGVAA